MVESVPQTRRALFSPSARSAQTSGIPSGKTVPAEFRIGRKSGWSTASMTMWTAAKKKARDCSLPGPEKALPNDLIVAADSDIDAEDGPCDERILMLGVRCHVGGSLHPVQARQY